MSSGQNYDLAMEELDRRKLARAANSFRFKQEEQGLLNRMSQLETLESDLGKVLREIRALEAVLNRRKQQTVNVVFSSGDNHMCYIAADGRLSCWGRPHSGQTEPPAELTKAVQCGHRFCCGVFGGHTVRCWGR